MSKFRIGDKVVWSLGLKDENYRIITGVHKNEYDDKYVYTIGDVPANFYDNELSLYEEEKKTKFTASELVEALEKGEIKIGQEIKCTDSDGEVVVYLDIDNILRYKDDGNEVTVSWICSGFNFELIEELKTIYTLLVERRYDGNFKEGCQFRCDEELKKGDIVTCSDGYYFKIVKSSRKIECSREEYLRLKRVIKINI